MGNRESRIETSVPDIPRITGPEQALVHDRLEGFSQLVIRSRKSKQAFTVDRFDCIDSLMPLLAPAAA